MEDTMKFQVLSFDVSYCEFVRKNCQPKLKLV